MSQQHPPRQFPIIREPYLLRAFPDCPRSIDWDYLAPHESQALRNHGQSLEKLASRGGLGPSEVYCIMNDTRLQSMPDAEAVQFLKALCA